MSRNKNQNTTKPETKVEEVKTEEEKPIDKFELAKEVLKKEKVEETVKQKGVYSLMGSFQIVRN